MRFVVIVTSNPFVLKMIFPLDPQEEDLKTPRTTIVTLVVDHVGTETEQIEETE